MEKRGEEKKEGGEKRTKGDQPINPRFCLFFLLFNLWVVFSDCKGLPVCKMISKIWF
jgi:hypothetical protein